MTVGKSSTTIIGKPYVLDEVRPYRQSVLSKSNFLIGTKYKSSVLENQITYMAMLQIQNGDYEEAADGIYVTLRASEIKEATENKAGSFYTNLKIVADGMTGSNMGIVDDEQHKFVFITLINKAEYSSGLFRIRFANELKEELININKNFTRLPAEIIYQFKHPYSFPLYQLLKSQCYYPSTYTGKKDYVFSITIGLSELKLDIGVVNADLKEVKAVLLAGKGRQEDYDRAVERSPEKKYERWSDLKVRCLDPTINEINTVSDIYVEYKPKMSGSPRKVYAVEFIVYLHGKNVRLTPVEVTEEGVEPKLSEDDKFVCWVNTSNLFAPEYQLKLSEIQEICKAANYDIAAIEKAVTLLKRSSTKINNIVGWVITAIRERFELNESVSKNSNMLNNYNQRDYDMDELERVLLSKKNPPTA